MRNETMESEINRLNVRLDMAARSFKEIQQGVEILVLKIKAMDSKLEGWRTLLVEFRGEDAVALHESLNPKVKRDEKDTD